MTWEEKGDAVIDLVKYVRNEAYKKFAKRVKSLGPNRANFIIDCVLKELVDKNV